MKLKREREEVPPERGLPGTQDTTFPVRGDVYLPARARCRECGTVFPLTVQLPWQRMRSAHGGPRAAQLVLEGDGHEVREGVDVPGPLCRRCFDKLAPAALEAKRAEWKARLESARSDMERRKAKAEAGKARADREHEERIAALDAQISSLEGED